MIMIDIKLKVLTKPEDVECVSTYSLPSSNSPIYNVCITNNGKYIIYDLLSKEKGIDESIKKLEEKLVDLLMESDDILNDLKRRKGVDKKLLYIVERQLTGYGLLEALFQDPEIVNMHIIPNKPIQIIHRVYGRLESNIVLSNDEVREYAMRLASIAGKSISEAIPIASFIEPRYESRVTIIYQSDITMKRSMIIDIRRPVEKPWTILKLIQLGSLSIEEAAFLWLMVKYKVPIVIVGEIFTGKTTLATAILSLVPPWSRVMTIEDAPEIRIPIEYWTRTTIREYGERKIGVFDLVKTSVRLSLDYIIIGEIRGEEAREWANAILLGHGAITTFHAESPESALIRLVSPPISVDPQVVNLLNVFVKTNLIELQPGRQVFRHEVYIHEDARVKPLFIYNRAIDKIVISEYYRDKDIFNELKFIEKICNARRVSKEALREEYKAMINALTTIYNEYSSIDPLLDKPSYIELPRLLYNKLFTYVATNFIKE